MHDKVAIVRVTQRVRNYFCMKIYYNGVVNLAVAALISTQVIQFHIKWKLCPSSLGIVPFRK